MKTKYILHGGFTCKDNDLNASFFHEFTSDIPTDAKILMVFFASGDEDKTSTYNELIEKISKSKPYSQFSFILPSQKILKPIVVMLMQFTFMVGTHLLYLLP